MYFNILKRAINKQPEIRNIALAGTYGTGKSSILKKVGEEYNSRVIEVSLLTLGTEPDATTDSQESNPAATTTTNRIQKEIVKQLLYQQRPTDAPASRFRRIVRFRWGIEIGLAAGAGLIAAVLAFIAGLDMAFGPSLGLTLVERPRFVAVTALYLTLALAAGSALLVVRALIRGRLRLESVTAGPATITLPPRSTSYFDEYLDEIIYFFEMNPARNIVIIEDLDRFDDPKIFEALRSLNGLLNAARQLQNQNIRFIYALRDSVFEKLGRDNTGNIGDEARGELVRANRTKFFELVIPVVPFITHKNARDLMHSLLTERGHEISKDLIDLAARHVADMRLIHNIVNEYEVFKFRLLDVDRPVPGLDAERLFAMILFKNTHLGDFERIRHAESSLDVLWELWRALVNQNLERIRTDSQQRRAYIADRHGASMYAENLAAELRKRINALAVAPGSGFAGPTLYMDGGKVDTAQMQSVEFWQTFIQEQKSLTAIVLSNTGGYGSKQHMQLSKSTIEALVGIPIDGHHFVENEVLSDQSKLDINSMDLTFLQRHTWKELAEATKFKYMGKSDGVDRSFREWVEYLLPSRLAVDLVVNGYINSHFSLHVSSFYGQLIRPDAMVYVLRCVDQGRPDPDYSLEPDDVEAILRDQGTSVLVEPSMFNIGVLNHLLETRPNDATIVIRNLLDSSYNPDFINNYLGTGSAKAQLVEQLTPVMPGVFSYLANASELEAEERIRLVAVAIMHRSSRVQYEKSDALRQLIEREYRPLLSFVPSENAQAAGAAVAFISWTGAVLADVSDLTDEILTAFRGSRAYALTAENLEEVVDSRDISLDTLHGLHEEAFLYATASIDAYLGAYNDSPGTPFTINLPSLFAEVLNASATWNREDFEGVIVGSSPECRVESLADVPSAAWPALVRTQRAPMTFKNVAAYSSTFEHIDSDIAVSLGAVTEIGSADSQDQAARSSLALGILNAPTNVLSAEQRVKLTESLDVGEFDVNGIRPMPGRLIGDLIAAGLVADDKDAFASRLMLDWETQLHTIRMSQNFLNFASPDTLQPQYLVSLFRSEELGPAHAAIAGALHSYTDVPRAALEAAAKRAVEGAFTIDAAWIDMMRKGGVGVTVVIDLLAVADGDVTLTELRAILRALGAPWAKIADRGYGVHEVLDSPAAKSVLERLKAAEIVSKFPLEGSVRRVSLRRPRDSSRLS
ncbi:hypothetical protein [Arthrobacter sp. zg-Y877]|uniref:YobI family P-loop NTPase n=1 Tax=Arthrobacter sp. zg-Y877 TaxID=3049074 RepID=UPI0025A3BE89|nr:hypothetical protein [Arthrobacter sp. zg-Y877]MDM7991510.1 hypothetical protein [Arthrobacter sp. zg-Y877]